jgi:hypothetical protein
VILDRRRAAFVGERPTGLNDTVESDLDGNGFNRVNDYSCGWQIHCPSSSMHIAIECFDLVAVLSESSIAMYWLAGL